MTIIIRKYAIGILATIFILFCFLLYGYPLIASFNITKEINATSFFISRLFIWAVLLLLLFYAKYIENGKILLQKDENYSLVRFLLNVVILYFATAAAGGILNVAIQHIFHEHISSKLSEINSFLHHNFWMIFFVSLTAGVTEEIIFRGYIQTRLQIIYNNSFISIAITSVLFGLMHLTYGTVSNFAVALIIGVIFGIFYHKYKNIKILIVVHFLIDFISLMIMNYSQH